jgi:hypothetical protein
VARSLSPLKTGSAAEVDQALHVGSQLAFALIEQATSSCRDFAKTRHDRVVSKEMQLGFEPARSPAQADEAVLAPDNRARAAEGAAGGAGRRSSPVHLPASPGA